MALTQRCLAALRGQQADKPLRLRARRMSIPAPVMTLIVAAAQIGELHPEQLRIGIGVQLFEGLAVG